MSIPSRLAEQLTRRSRPARTAGILWILTASVYLLGETIAAAAYPGYDYATNYISDLGAPIVGSYSGRAIDSPLHGVMNTAFVLQGVLYLSAAIVAARLISSMALKRAAIALFLMLAIIHSVGVVLVGLFPETSPDGLERFHVLGAGMSILGGNAASVAVGLVAWRLGARPWYAIVSVVLGVVGAVSLGMLTFDAGTTAVNLLPDGIWERAAVYAITVWELMTGVLLIRAARGSRVS